MKDLDGFWDDHGVGRFSMGITVEDVEVYDIIAS